MANPFVPLAFDNPRGARRPIEQTVRGSTLALTGRDRFFAGEGQGPDYDWPLPARATRPALSWTQQSLLVTTLARPVGQASLPASLPRPRGDVGQVLAARLILLGQDNLPPGEQFWALPPSPKRRVDGIVQSTPQGLFGQDALPVGRSVQTYAIGLRLRDRGALSFSVPNLLLEELEPLPPGMALLPALVRRLSPQPTPMPPNLLLSAFWPPVQFPGLRVFDSGVLELCLVPLAMAPAGNRLEITKNGVTLAVYLVDPTDPHASPVRVKTAAGVKAIRLKT